MLKSAAKPGTDRFDVVNVPSELMVVMGTSMKFPMPPAVNPERPLVIFWSAIELIVPSPPHYLNHHSPRALHTTSTITHAPG
ncbi:MAG: hypothetical protein L0922_02035, partial [Candidatus Mariimomonas ferrooxydans]